MHVDPRSPLVINTHDVERRPGSMRTRDFTVAAPADLGIELLGVPEGSPLEVELRLEAVMEGVLASGRAWVMLTGECARCLDAIEDDLEVTFQELYVYPESDATEDEASRLDQSFLDLEPTIRDAIVLALPFQPVCDPSCRGLCLECGVKLVDDNHTHGDDIDPRWVALAELSQSTAEQTPRALGADPEE